MESASLMEQQHRTMIAAIKRGRFDATGDYIEDVASDAGAAVA